MFIENIQMLADPIMSDTLLCNMLYDKSGLLRTARILISTTV